jgi:hypothetical protein
MTMVLHAITGMRTKIGVQKEVPRNGANLNIHGATSIPLVQIRNQLFTLKGLNKKAS